MSEIDDIIAYKVKHGEEFTPEETEYSQKKERLKAISEEEY